MRRRSRRRAARAGRGSASRRRRPSTGSRSPRARAAAADAGAARTARREDAVRHAAEVVERARLHRPDRPAVPLHERPHRERVERMREQDERDDERRDADGARPDDPSAVRGQSVTWPTWCQLAQAAPRRDAEDQREHDELREPDRYVDQREVSRQSAGRADADHVGDPESRSQLGARTRDPQQRQERGADDEVEQVRERAVRRASPSTSAPAPRSSCLRRTSRRVRAARRASADRPRPSARRRPSPRESTWIAGSR